jgi:putative MATE family efflux protein
VVADGSIAPVSAPGPLALANLRSVWRLALPVVAANLLQTLVNVVDVLFAGRLGPVEVAAVGLATSVRLLLLVVVMAVSAGAMALAAQATGGRDETAASAVARQSLLLAAALGVVLTLLGIPFAGPLLGLLDASGDATAILIATPYLVVLFAGSAFLVGQIVTASLMQGAGDTLTPLVLAAITNGLNVVLTWMLVFGIGPAPALGVTGAAVGTVVARALGLAAALWVLGRGRTAIGFGAAAARAAAWRPDLGRWRDLLAIGWPAGAQSLAYSAAGLVLMRIVTSTPSGSLGAAALAIGLQVEALAFMPGVAISVAATSLVGRALGAWQLDAARAAGRAALTLGVLFMSAVAVVLFAAAEPLVRLFDPSAHPVLVADGVSYLRINALAQPLLAVFMVLSGALRGAGDTRPALVGTVVGRWLVVLPLAWWWALGAGLGVVGVWWAFVVGIAVQASWVGWRWWRGDWPSVALGRTALYRTHLARLDPATREAYLREVRAPLLARHGCTEHVDPGGVRYRYPGGELRVRFDVSGFEAVRE